MEAAKRLRSHSPRLSLTENGKRAVTKTLGTCRKPLGRHVGARSRAGESWISPLPLSDLATWQTGRRDGEADHHGPVAVTRSRT